MLPTRKHGVSPALVLPGYSKPFLGKIAVEFLEVEVRPWVCEGRDDWALQLRVDKGFVSELAEPLRDDPLVLREACVGRGHTATRDMRLERRVEGDQRVRGRRESE